MPLRYEWVLWEQLDNPDPKTVNYANTTRALATFKTVHDSWRYWIHLPQPNELLLEIFSFILEYFKLQMKLGLR